MKKFMNGFVKGVYTVLLVSIFAFITYYSISNLVTGNYLSNSKLMIVAIVFYILIILALVLLTKITSKKIFFMIVTGMAILVRIGWLIKVPTAPSSDFQMMHHAAILATQGDLSFLKESYFQSWPYQLGFVYFQALIIKIFGQNVLILQIINILLNCGIAFVGYKIINLHFKEITGRIVYTLLLFYPAYIYMTGVLTNQFLATFLIYLAIYLYLKHDQLWVKATAGVLLALGNMMRPLGILLIIALVCFEITKWLLAPDRENILKSLGRVTTSVLAYFLMLFLVNSALQVTHLSEYPLENRNPTWKFVLGLNDETVGSYSATDLSLMNRYPLGAKRDKLGKEIIKERIQDKPKLVNLMFNKSKKMWTVRDDALMWGMADNVKLSLKIKNWLNAVQFLFYIFIVANALLAVFKWRETWTDGYLLKLMIIGYFMVHLLIEIQSRYRFFIVPAFIMLTAIGWVTVYEKIHSRQANDKKTLKEDIVIR